MRRNTPKRAANLELLRILCMFMIVLAHCIGHGGIADSVELAGINKQLIAMIQALISVLINCFVLISGYFLSQGQFRIRKFLDIWVTALFWSALLTSVCMFSGLTQFSLTTLIKAFLPFTQQQYWFITTYLLMYLMVPMLNAAANHLEQRQFATFLITFFLVYFLLQHMVFWREFTQMGIRDPLFFAYLYMVAAYVRRFPIQKKHRWFLGYFLLCVGIWLSGMASRLIPEPIEVSFAATGYNRPLVVLASIFLFMGFESLEIKHDFLEKMILSVAPLTFGVYLIHDNNAVRSLLWKALFIPDELAADIMVVPKVLLISVMVFLGCLPLEAMRKKLFSTMRVSSLCENIERWINAALDWIVSGVFHIEV